MIIKVRLSDPTGPKIYCTGESDTKFNLAIACTSTCRMWPGNPDGRSKSTLWLSGNN